MKSKLKLLNNNHKSQSNPTKHTDHEIPPSLSMSWGGAIAAAALIAMPSSMCSFSCACKCPQSTSSLVFKDRQEHLLKLAKTFQKNPKWLFALSSFLIKP